MCGGVIENWIYVLNKIELGVFYFIDNFWDFQIDEKYKENNDIN